MSPKSPQLKGGMIGVFLLLISIIIILSIFDENRSSRLDFNFREN